jgi:HEAT repeat protein
MRGILEATGFRGLAAFAMIEPIRVEREKRYGLRLRLGGDEAAELDALVAEVEDKDHGKALVAALRETLAPGQDDLLIENLRVGNAPLRRAAAVLLGHLAQEPWRCVGDIEKALNDEDKAVREAAAAALVRWALDDKEEAVRDAARAALERGKR